MTEQRPSGVSTIEWLESIVALLKAGTVPKDVCARYLQDIVDVLEEEDE